MQNMAEYRLSPSAQRDLADIWHYTNTKWGKDQANRYTLMLKAMCGALAAAPHQGVDCTFIKPGYRRRNTEHHVIYFRRTTYGIAIIRILHQRMDAKLHM